MFTQDDVIPIKDHSARLRPFIVRGFFDQETYQKVKSRIDEIVTSNKDKDVADRNDPEHSRFYRHYEHNEPLLAQLHTEMQDRASELIGVKVKKSYAFLSMYRGEGICPLHTDRPQCKFTIDLCISQSKPWAIYVDGKKYWLEENDALVYSGSDSPHYRNKIEPGNFCNLAFFHFVEDSFEGVLD